MKTNYRPHVNVVLLLGIISDTRYPLCIVTDYMASGSLDKYLKEREPDAASVINFCKGIAAGMMHLHLENIVVSIYDNQVELH